MSTDKQKAKRWADNLTNVEWINLLKKHGHYYHDIGINEEELIKMWKMENQIIIKQYKPP